LTDFAAFPKNAHQKPKVTQIGGPEMSGEFLGKFKTTVNKKKWIVIPAVLKKRFSSAAKQTVVITLGPNGNSLVVYPEDNWNAKLKSLRNGNQHSLMLRKRLIHYAQNHQKLESNGRVKVSEELLQKTGIKDKVIIKGEGDYISMWNPENFKKYEEKLEQETGNMFDTMDYQL